jgi:hypothetical protein
MSCICRCARARRSASRSPLACRCSKRCRCARPPLPIPEVSCPLPVPGRRWGGATAASRASPEVPRPLWRGAWESQIVDFRMRGRARQCRSTPVHSNNASSSDGLKPLNRARRFIPPPPALALLGTAMRIVRGVRVHVSRGCHRGEGNRRASPNCLVSSPETSHPKPLTSRLMRRTCHQSTMFAVERAAQRAGGPAAQPAPLRDG